METQDDQVEYATHFLSNASGAFDQMQSFYSRFTHNEDRSNLIGRVAGLFQKREDPRHATSFEFRYGVYEDVRHIIGDEGYDYLSEKLQVIAERLEKKALTIEDEAKLHFTKMRHAALDLTRLVLGTDYERSEHGVKILRIIELIEAYWDAQGEPDWRKRMLGYLNDLVELQDAIRGIDIPRLVQSRRSEFPPFRRYEEDTPVRSDSPPVLPAEDESPGDLISMDQAAALVGRTKRTVQGWNEIDPMPLPEVEGGGGKRHEYSYAKLKPWLEQHSGRKLPDQLPDLR
ncbi:MAG TPA: hypothetical protein VGN72_07705 [Tepidisphaeraceae bacterium]|jgi:hypothetical protein|nr:hypothetical protein [Tepidisphaeraceae bacterium]